MNPIARTEGILTEAFGSELVLYDQRAKKAHRLNPTATFLWRNCDGTRTVADLAKLVHQEMRLPEDQELVSLALEPLKKQRLIDTSSSPDGVSRRDVIKRLRAIGVAAAMIPIVATIVAPPPAAAASRSGTTTETTTDPWGNRPTGSSVDDRGQSKSEPFKLQPWR